MLDTPNYNKYMENERKIIELIEFVDYLAVDLDLFYDRVDSIKIVFKYFDIDYQKYYKEKEMIKKDILNHESLSQPDVSF